MRVNGVNAVAVLIAAVAMYLIGFLIYGVLFDQYWMQLQGYTQDQLAPHMWKMALSPVMPILNAIGIALVVKWRGAYSLAGGVTSGLFAFVLFTLATRLYAYAYGPEPVALLALDGAHLLATHLVAGAIIGVMK